MKVLLDTGTLLSGLVFKGPENMIIWGAIQGKFRLVVSDYILLEFEKNISRKFTGKRRKRAIELLTKIKDYDALEIKGRKDYLSHLREAEKVINKKDAPVLACAMLDDIDVLVSGDEDFYTGDVRDKVNVMRAREFLETYY